MRRYKPARAVDTCSPQSYPTWSCIPGVLTIEGIKPTDYDLVSDVLVGAVSAGRNAGGAEYSFKLASSLRHVIAHPNKDNTRQQETSVGSEGRRGRRGTPTMAMHIW